MRPVFVLFSLIISSCADPIIIRSGVSTHKDEGRRQDANVYDLNSAKGVSSYQGEEGYNHDNESKRVQAQDSGKYNEESGKKKLHSNENNYADDKYHQNQGGEVADYNKKSANKKGHHKSGYTKSFHKDESASTSSFYDDADNEDSEYVHNNKKNLYGDAGQHSQRGSHVDDQKYIQDEGKNGYYNNAGKYEKDLGNRQDYNSKKYYDAKENEGRRNAAHQYDEDDRYGHERYLKKHPHYYYDEPYPITAPKKTITIYEDPRYDGYEKYPAYDNDYIQLEVKRPPRNYDYRYYDRPSYDYYY
ncbi:hypothetical protein TcasGA2_TC007528 [Tribolium castaneum]|uniref:Uncharacterized protein n=1 Tax=Tribolium castaneum TaxID=7070 RepID=D2A3F9_TRICA|nr:hypothetical protein TcasGA2_TC007528 [Tribolium castaneum]